MIRARVAMKMPVGSWIGLEVMVKGKEITARVVDGRSLRFTAPRPVAGYLGLWAKGDTTAFFRNLEMDDAVQKEKRSGE